MPFLGEISALITALLWAFTSIIFTEASLRIGSVQLNINRLIAALTFLTITVFVFGLNYILSAEQYAFLAVSGIVGLAIGDGFLFKSFQTIGARFSMLIMALVPGITAILGYFFLHESLSLQTVIGMIVTVGGVSIVVLEKNNGNNARFKITKIGFFYGFMGAVCQAGGLILAKEAFNVGEINGFVATFIRIFTSVLVMLPFLLIIGRYKNPVRLYRHDLKSLALTIAGSIVGPFLGITFSLIAISNTKVGIASTLMATTPILLLPIIKILYKEKIPTVGIIGAVLAVLGVAILFLS